MSGWRDGRDVPVQLLAGTVDGEAVRVDPVEVGQERVVVHRVLPGELGVEKDICTVVWVQVPEDVHQHVPAHAGARGGSVAITGKTQDALCVCLENYNRRGSRGTCGLCTCVGANIAVTDVLS